MSIGKPNPSVSVVLRTKNEVHSIRQCIEAIRSQKYEGEIEIVVVDNGSTDGTDKVSQSLASKFLEIYDYTPGRALNLGVANSVGEICIFTSAHCVPENPNWIEKLVEPFVIESASAENLAGVYGRQIPEKTSDFIDIKDMWTIFGPEARKQYTDPFFHNSNSAIPKDILLKFPFDDSATNVEDRIWARLVQSHGYFLYYSPWARVIHAHGINHHKDLSHAERVVMALKQYGVYE